MLRPKDAVAQMPDPLTEVVPVARAQVPRIKRLKGTVEHLQHNGLALGAMFPQRGVEQPVAGDQPGNGHRLLIYLLLQNFDYARELSVSH